MKIDFDQDKDYIIAYIKNVAVLYSEKIAIALLDNEKRVLFEKESNGKVTFTKHLLRFKRESAFQRDGVYDNRKVSNVDFHELLDKI